MATLSILEQRFAAEYPIDWNGGPAAARAGYTGNERTLRSTAHRLLQKPEIRSAIQDALDRRNAACEITAQQVVAELAKVGFANMGDYMRTTGQGDPYLDLSDLSREQSAVLSEVTVEDYVDGRGDDARDVKKIKIKLHDKIKALELLGKHLGVFRDVPMGGTTINVFTGVPDADDSQQG